MVMAAGSNYHCVGRAKVLIKEVGEELANS